MVLAAQELTHTNDYGELEHTLAEIVERIREQDARRHSLAGLVKKLKNGIDLTRISELTEIIDQELVVKVEPDHLSNAAVAGVDGGMLCAELHGLDLILVRAVGAIFHYREGELSAAEYYPDEAPEPRLIPIMEPLDAREFELIAGMQRQLTELRLATHMAEICEADLLLLDGSVVPQYVDRFPHGKRVMGAYRELMRAFIELYETCAGRGVLLAGAVKDSRSARFLDVFRRKVLPGLIEGGSGGDETSVLARGEDIFANSRDTAFLNHLLEPGERSCVLKYADATSVLHDLGGWAKKVYAFYLKSVPYDYPLRVELIDGKGEVTPTVERVASMLYALSGHHDSFGLPPVLIEADACARLTEEDFDVVRDGIMDRLGPSAFLDLRRNRRPF